MMRRSRPKWVSICALVVAEGVPTVVWAAEETKPAAFAPVSPGPGTPASDRPLVVPSPVNMPSIFAPKAGKAPPRPSSSAPSRRALSPEMVTKLGGVVKQALAALPPAPPRREGADDPDVVRMDTYRVEENEAPDSKELDLRFKKAFDDMAKQLGGSALGGPGVAEAASDGLERQRGREATELIDLTRIGGGSVPPGMKKMIDEMNTRVNDPRAQNGTPFKEAQVINRF